MISLLMIFKLIGRKLWWSTTQKYLLSSTQITLSGLPDLSWFMYQFVHRRIGQFYCNVGKKEKRLITNGNFNKSKDWLTQRTLGTFEQNFIPDAFPEFLRTRPSHWYKHQLARQREQ